MKSKWNEVLGSDVELSPEQVLKEATEFLDDYYRLGPLGLPFHKEGVAPETMEADLLPSYTARLAEIKEQASFGCKTTLTSIHHRSRRQEPMNRLPMSLRLGASWLGGTTPSVWAG